MIFDFQMECSLFLCGILNASGHPRGNGCLRCPHRTFRKAVQETGGEVCEKGDGESLKKGFLDYSKCKVYELGGFGRGKNQYHRN